MATKYKTVGELFSESSAVVKRNLRLFIVFNILTILSVAWTIGLVLRDKAQGHDWGSVIWRSFFDANPDYKINSGLNLLISVAGIVLYILAAILAVKAAQHHKEVAFADVWETFQDKWWKIILTIVLIAIPVLAGLILLILPGLYLLARLGLAPYAVIDQDLGPAEAVTKSWDMTRGRAWPVFVAVFFGAILQIPSIIPVIGSIISLILTIAYSAGTPIRYFEYKKVKAHAKA